MSDPASKQLRLIYLLLPFHKPITTHLLFTRSTTLHPGAASRCCSTARVLDVMRPSNKGDVGSVSCGSNPSASARQTMRPLPLPPRAAASSGGESASRVSPFQPMAASASYAVVVLTTVAAAAPAANVPAAALDGSSSSCCRCRSGYGCRRAVVEDGDVLWTGTKAAAHAASSTSTSTSGWSVGFGHGFIRARGIAAAWVEDGPHKGHHARVVLRVPIKKQRRPSFDLDSIDRKHLAVMCLEGCLDSLIGNNAQDAVADDVADESLMIGMTG